MPKARLKKGVLSESLIFGPILGLLDTLVSGNSKLECDDWFVASYSQQNTTAFCGNEQVNCFNNDPRLHSRCLVIFYVWSHSGLEPAENIQLDNLDEAGCQICCTKVCVPQGNMSNLRSHLWT